MDMGHEMTAQVFETGFDGNLSSANIDAFFDFFVQVISADRAATWLLLLLLPPLKYDKMYKAYTYIA